MAVAGVALVNMFHKNFKMKKILSLTALAILIGFTSCEAQEKSKTETTMKSTGVINLDVNVAEFEKQMAGNGLLLDVRTNQEYAEGHLKGSKQIDFYRPDFKTQLEALDKETPVYIYCRSGGRSGNAAKMMKDMGFKEVYNLEGGIGAWQRAGKPLEK